eukprot:tig00001041_g6562.t1
MPNLAGQAHACRVACCMHIACRMIAPSALDRSKLSVSTPADPKTFRSTCYLLANLVRDRYPVPPADMKHIVATLNLPPRTAESAQNLLKVYEERFLKGLPPGRASNVDFSSDGFAAAALFLGARQLKAKPNADRICAELMVPDDEFQQRLKSMQKYCEDDLKGAAKGRSAKPAAGSTSSAAAPASTSKPQDPSEIFVGQERYERNKEAENVAREANREKNKREYEAWKESVLSKPKPKLEGGCAEGEESAAAAAATAAAPKRMKQATLFDAFKPKQPSS